MTEAKKPAWMRYAIAGVIGGAAVSGGQRLSTDSPIHFAVEGDVPPGADAQWVCLPEGGIIGAPMVCRPKAEVVSALKAKDTFAETSASENTEVTNSGHDGRTNE